MWAPTMCASFRLVPSASKLESCIWPNFLHLKVEAGHGQPLPCLALPFAIQTFMFLSIPWILVGKGIAVPTLSWETSPVPEAESRSVGGELCV